MSSVPGPSGPSVALRDIAAELGGELVGDPALAIAAIRPLESAGPDAIAFVANPRYRSQLASSHAGCVIVAPALRDAAAERGAALVVDDPYRAYAQLTRWWKARHQTPSPAGVHPRAWVDPSARVAASATVAAFAVIDAGASVADGAVIGAHSVVGPGAAVGEGTVLAAHVTLGARCRIGARSIVHSGVVIGADGFGFAPHGGRWEKIEQLGNVRIGNDVEIGANTCIDRGALDDTVIEDGVKLDNLIQIGHNVHVGAHTIMAGGVAVAGSTRIGRHCGFGGRASIAGHLEIVDRVQVTACTTVTHSLLKVGTYSGSFPMDDNATWVKNAATLRQLHVLRDRIRLLEAAKAAGSGEKNPAGPDAP